MISPKWLVLLLLLVTATPVSVSAQCAAPPLGWAPLSPGSDNPIKVEVQSGINAGQTGQISRLYGHGNPSTGSYGGNAQFYIEIRRIVDANGQPSNTLVSAEFYPTEVIQGCEVVPAKPGCSAHGYATQRFGSQGVFDLEAKLAFINPPTGTYETKIFFWQGVYTVTRTWGIFSNPGVTFFVNDEAGEPINGANLICHRVDNPAVEIPIGPTSGGQIGDHLAPGDYAGTWTAPNATPKPVIFGVTTLAPNSYHITMARTASTPTGKGDLKVIVLDYTMAEGEPVPLSAATVSVAGRTRFTNGTGEAVFKDMVPGTYTATVSHTGRVTGGVQVKVAEGLTRTYKVTMYADKAPTVSDTTEGEPGFWERLLVPQKETLEGWSSLIDSMKSWGPFGVVNAFFTSFNHATLSGETELIFTLVWQPMGATYEPWKLALDFRPGLTVNDPAYPDGGRGSVFGTFLTGFRALMTGVTWAAFLAFLWRVAPRFLS